MTDKEMMNNILSKYKAKYPDAPDMEEYIEYVYDMNRAELEFENTLLPDWL